MKKILLLLVCVVSVHAQKASMRVTFSGQPSGWSATFYSFPDQWENKVQIPTTSAGTPQDVYVHGALEFGDAFVVQQAFNIAGVWYTNATAIPFPLQDHYKHVHVHWLYSTNGTWPLSPVVTSVEERAPVRENFKAGLKLGGVLLFTGLGVRFLRKVGGTTDTSV